MFVVLYVFFDFQVIELLDFFSTEGYFYLYVMGECGYINIYCANIKI